MVERDKDDFTSTKYKLARLVNSHKTESRRILEEMNIPKVIRRGRTLTRPTPGPGKRLWPD